MNSREQLSPGSRPDSIALSVEEAFDVALKLHRGGNLDSAEILYGRIIETAPDHLNALHFYGLLCNHQQRQQEAAALIQRIIEVAPENADAHNNLGNVFDGMGRLQDAEACYRKAVDLNPDHAPALNNMGVVLMARKAVSEALVAYHRAVRLSPDVPNFRYNLGNALRKCGQVDEAAAAYRKAVELEPTHVGAWQGLSRTLIDAGRREEAAGVFSQWIEKDPQNPIALYQQAACLGLEAPGRAPDAYVQKTFDELANRFDEHLQNKLDYRAPQLLIDALGKLLPPPDGSLDILDAGCGTGLCGPLLRPYARRLVGVDLSAGMLTRARGVDAYDELVQAELTDFLNRQKKAYNLIVSADTLCYFGDIEPVLAAAASHALKPGGLMAFTLEDAGEKGVGWKLKPHGRYSHGAEYVKNALVETGYSAQPIISVKLRKEGGQPVRGHLVTAYI